MGNALAQLVVTPLILYWVIGAPWRAPAPNLTRTLEACALAVGLVVSCYLSCTVDDKSIHLAQARFYAPLAVHVLGGHQVWHARRIRRGGGHGLHCG